MLNKILSKNFEKNLDGERTAGGYQFIAFGWKKNCRWLPVHSIWMEKELQVVTSS